VRGALFESRPPEDTVCAIALGLAGVVIWWIVTADLDLRYAWGGWSAADWINHRNLPEHFARDFPSGVTLYEKSAFMWIYALADRWLGIPAEAMPRAVVAIELAAMAAASCALAGALFTQRRLLVGVTLLVLLVASSGPNLDLARFGMPYPFALYYYFAEAARLAAIACALRGRYVASGVLLGLAAITHPVMAFYAALFIAAAMIVAPRELLSRRAALGACALALATTPWFAWQFLGDSAGPLAAAPAHELWLPVAMAFSYHFFPVQFGLFAEFAHERFLPLLSFFALYAYYLSRVDLPRDLARRLTAGVLVMGAIAAIGVVLSAAAPSPLIVKLSLHRASLLAVLLALPVIVAGLWRDMLEGSVVRRFCAAAVLFSAFFMQPGWPLLFSLILCFPAWRGALGRAAPIGDRAAAALLAGGCLLAAGYRAAELVPASANIYWAPAGAWALAALFVVLAWIAVRAGGRAAAGAVAGVPILLIACGLWLAGRALPPAQARLYADFKAAQLWARDHTPVTALFMVDPSHYYGWRDYSRRSSFGNLREWLHTSSVYARGTAFEEGLARFREFGIELEPYLDQRPSTIKGGDALTPEIARRYNAADDAWRRSMAARHGIDYFVIDKRGAAARSALPVAFENRSFRVLQAAPAPGAMTGMPPR
jgi:hypothetical protein